MLVYQLGFGTGERKLKFRIAFKQKPFSRFSSLRFEIQQCVTLQSDEEIILYITADYHLTGMNGRLSARTSTLSIDLKAHDSSRRHDYQHLYACLFFFFLLVPCLNNKEHQKHVSCCLLLWVTPKILLRWWCFPPPHNLFDLMYCRFQVISEWVE